MVTTRVADTSNDGTHGLHSIPLLMYGTAWKEETTAELTETAIIHGFTAIDTANFPTSYNEPLTGEGIAKSLQSGVKRSDLFIQTKFTPAHAHAPGKIPYDANQSIEGQIIQSIQQSFDHLKVDYIDALLLHCPFENDEDTLVAWKVFERYVPHKILYLGVSNFTLQQLQQLYFNSTVKPVFVQNRFWAETRFDFDVRAFCKDYGVIYQAFGIIRRNPEVLASDVVALAAEKLKVDKPLAFLVLVLSLDADHMRILDGTTKIERMEKDLLVFKEVFGSAQTQTDLAPVVSDFRRLLWKLIK